MEIPLWIEFFEDLQHIRGRSLNTVLAYRRDLEFWKAYSDPSHSVMGFYDFLKQQNLSVRSQARIISSLRTYFRFCESRGQKSPELRELRPPKVKAKLPHAITPEEFQRLFQASEVPDRPKTIRNQMTLLFLYGLGCRVSELIELDLANFHPTERWVKIIGKGKKERLVPLTELLVRQLDSYVKESRPSLLKENTASLLINDRGHRPSRVDIWRWLAAWSVRAGFPEPVHPHRFRHGCATALLDGGADLRSIQLILGHASLQTTQIYTNVSTQNLTAAIDESHPLSRVKK
ncbi:MAG: tyrosine-type recombinase/integrase [Bdellovibrionaceae bacterium]|nr:tyrosine-type recombinase/integrase [Pseudobdellovibrionaceae bacterium]